jgi:hypothetical protein
VRQPDLRGEERELVRAVATAALREPQTGALEPAPAAPAPAPVPDAIKAQFERYELKYWVPESLARAVEEWARPFVVRDPVGGGDGVQRNTSLYLDTPDHEFLDLHVEKAPDRFKLRVRRYGDPPSSPAFFEIKRKVKRVIAKRRALVAPEHVRGLLDGSTMALPPLKRASDQPHLEAFLYYMMVYRAVPTIYTSCIRTAYMSPDPEEDVRLTVDRNIVCQPATGFDFAPDPKRWVPAGGPEWAPAHEGTVILELKFRGTAPWWMAELTQALPLDRNGYSKYVAAVWNKLGRDRRDELDAVSRWEA